MHFYRDPGYLSRYSDVLRDKRPGFDFRQGKRFFSRAFRPALGPTQPPIRWVSVIPRGKAADQSPQSSAEVIYNGAIPLHVFMAWYLIKHRDRFTYVYAFL
jgi:hypothetical protein